MDAKKEISVELGLLSGLVSGISRQTPYEVPGGYFDHLPAQVLSRIAAKSPTFAIPDGYFEGFASQVLARIKAGAVNNSSGQSGFVMGEEGVNEELARLSATVSRIGRKTPYQLPEGYFEEISPILTLLRDKPTYQAPAGYFEQLGSKIAAKAPNSMTGGHRPIAARVIPLGSQEKVLKGNWWKYSSVASIAACFILVFSWPQLHSDVMQTSEAHQLAIPDLAQISDQEMQNYLDDQNSILAEPVTSSTATLDMNDTDVKSLLGDVPDGDLQQYMEEHGRATDIATN